jgi:hypothetical protein
MKHFTPHLVKRLEPFEKIMHIYRKTGEFQAEGTVINRMREAADYIGLNVNWSCASCVADKADDIWNRLEASKAAIKAKEDAAITEEVISQPPPESNENAIDAILSGELKPEPKKEEPLPLELMTRKQLWEIVHGNGENIGKNASKQQLLKLAKRYV